MGRQAAAGTRADCGVRERAPPGFQERDVDGWPERRGEPARPCPSGYLVRGRGHRRHDGVRACTDAGVLSSAVHPLDPSQPSDPTRTVQVLNESTLTWSFSCLDGMDRATALLGAGGLATGFSGGGGGRRFQLGRARPVLTAALPVSPCFSGGAPWPPLLHCYKALEEQSLLVRCYSSASARTPQGEQGYRRRPGGDVVSEGSDRIECGLWKMHQCNEQIRETSTLG